MSKSWLKSIREEGCSEEEYTLACMISMEMAIQERVAADMRAQGYVSGWANACWRGVELKIHNFDLSPKDQCRWWDFEKSEASDVEWDPGYAELRAASGHPVGKRRRSRK